MYYEKCNNGAYIPKNKVYNDELELHFNKRGLTAKSLMRHLGRDKRYFISEGENAITMCRSAIDDCMTKNGFQLSDYEMLVICTDTPEYLTPTNAIRVAGLYGDEMKNIKVALDMNSNCTGMVMGVDFVSEYMKSKNIHKALVVGVFCVSPIAVWSDTVVYATMGDAAACVSLTMEESTVKRGVIDSEVEVDARYHGFVQYPKCGMAKAPLLAVMPNEKRLEWNPFDMDFISQKVVDIITKVLDKNSLTADDIDCYVFSQLSDAYNAESLRILGVDPNSDRYYFVGTEYGYTGNTCPFMCLNKHWKSIAKPGHKVMFCTYGSGYSLIAQLYQF